METEKDFCFPFEPYDIQNDFMKELYKCLETGKLGIFESPTGTGKSLSICCGALRWLLDNEAGALSLLRKQIEDLNISCHSDDTDGEDWLTSEYEKIQKTSEINMLRKKLEIITKHQEKIDNLKSRKIEEKLIKNKWLKNAKKTKNETKDPIELNVADKVDNDVPIDDADLLLEDTSPEIDEADEEEVEDSENDGVKIFFCSRTHSQLSQFVNEIKRTTYSTDVRVVSLASRQQYCINPTVQNLKSSHLINERCLDLQKGKKGKTTKMDEGKVTKRAKCSSGCQFYNQANIEQLRDEALIEIKDVEDLVSAGKEIQSCPYYSARAAIKLAQVVIVPYQTLLHEGTRRANGINLKGSVVIIDEAHNLLDTIEHIHGAEVTGLQLQIALDKLKQYKEKYSTRFAAKNLLYINQIIFVVSKILGILKSPLKKDQPTSEERKIYTLEEFVLTAEIDNYNLRPLLDFCEQSKLAQKLHGYSERYPLGNVKEDKKNNLKSFLNTISKKPKGVEVLKEEEQMQPERYVSVGNVIQNMVSFLDRLTSNYTDGRISTYRAKTTESGFHKFILLNPAAQFTNIIKDSRSIILAGGTMQPFSEFREQLFLSAGGTEDRIAEFSCGHVIPPENILPICLSEGPSGKKLNFSYEMRNSSEMLNELGRILQNVCNVVPGGIVCFFASYEYEKTVVNHLKANGILDKIENKKKIFREPKMTSQVEQVLNDYSKTIRSKNSNFTGALMFSVVGGKLSEGLNFSDDLGRCVIVVGMPYPNIKSVELMEKMKYLNENVSTTAGSIHYENLCMKAVNQCIGRAVRHAKDYAAVILVDERYSRDYICNTLPKWIQRSLVTNAKFGVIGSIGKFFSRHKSAS